MNRRHSTNGLLAGGTFYSFIFVILATNIPILRLFENKMKILNKNLSNTCNLSIFSTLSLALFVLTVVTDWGENRKRTILAPAG